MLDDIRGYLQMASGLTEVTAAKAREIAMALVGQGMSLGTKAPDVVGQVQELADDLVATSKGNRDLLTNMIRSEVDKAVGRMGFVREDELAALRRHVQRLESEVGDMRSELSNRPGTPVLDTVEAAIPAPKKKIYLEESDNG
jgi:polyhydroxyalkanoate synthesis regulator phasin